MELAQERETAKAKAMAQEEVAAAAQQAAAAQAALARASEARAWGMAQELLRRSADAEAQLLEVRAENAQLVQRLSEVAAASAELWQRDQARGVQVEVEEGQGLEQEHFSAEH